MRVLLRVGQTLDIEDCRLKNEYSIVNAGWFGLGAPPRQTDIIIFEAHNQLSEDTSRCVPQKTYNPVSSAKDASVIFSSEASFTASAVGRDMAKMIGIRARAAFWTSS